MHTHCHGVPKGAQILEYYAVQAKASATLTEALLAALAQPGQLTAIADQLEDGPITAVVRALAGDHHPDVAAIRQVLITIVSAFKDKTDQGLQQQLELQSSMGDFLRGSCVVVPGAEVDGTELHNTYRAWCELNGRPANGRRTFYKRLRRLGFVGEEREGQRYVWPGIALDEVVDLAAANDNALADCPA